MPRGTASGWKTRYAVRLTVPRRGGWRAWGAVRADFERALADAADPAIASAEVASEFRRGADYVRVSVALTVVTTDVADALAIAWEAFRGAARDDVTGWEVAAATAQVQPEPPLTLTYPADQVPGIQVLQLPHAVTNLRVTQRGRDSLTRESGSAPAD